MFDVIILGSGPAGLTAAIYTTRANLKTLVIAGTRWGGQLMITGLVENFPGFPEGIQGPDLMNQMRKQAQRHGAEILDIDFTEGNFTRLPKKPLIIKADGYNYQTKAVIIATGADTKWLGVPGEKELIGRGVSSCATCDAPFFRGKKVIVVGGGDTAMEDALHLTKFVDSVTVVHRRDSFRASQIMQQRAKAEPKIQFIPNTSVVKILGNEKVTGVRLENVKTGEKKEMVADGVFVAIGLIPNTSPFKGVELDENGYVVVYNHTKTNIPGVFVAGDVHDAHYKQAITAAGFGCMAALSTERWLRGQE